MITGVIETFAICRLYHIGSGVARGIWGPRAPGGTLRGAALR